MMTVDAATTTVASASPTVRELIAAIEADLARISDRLGAVRRAETSGIADTTRIISELAALKDQSGRMTDQLAATPLEMTPLALLSLDSEQLTLIKGVDANAARLLNDNGLHRFSDIAALMPEDVKELSGQLRDRSRIARQGWIEQAALLASGVETAYAARVRAGDFVSVVAAPLAAPSPLPAPANAPASASAIQPGAIIAPLETAKSAAVIDLAGQRAERNRKSSNFGQIGGMAIAAALVLALTLNAGTLAGMAWGNGGKAACGHSIGGIANAGECTIAQLP